MLCVCTSRANIQQYIGIDGNPANIDECKKRLRFKNDPFPAKFIQVDAIKQTVVKVSQFLGLDVISNISYIIIYNHLSPLICPLGGYRLGSNSHLSRPPRSSVQV